MNQTIKIIFVSLALSSPIQSYASWFSANDCPAWAQSCNDWPVWTPMYWMQEMSNEIGNLGRTYDPQSDYSYTKIPLPTFAYAPYSIPPLASPPYRVEK